MLPAGGDFARRDSLTKGKVQVIGVPDTTEQAHAVLTELHRLQDVGVSDWSTVAVLSSTHRDLALVRALAEALGVPVRWNAGKAAMPALHQIREIRRFLQLLSGSRSRLHRASDLSGMADGLFPQAGTNPWVAFLHQLLAAWKIETQDAELPVTDALEFFYEACMEGRREFNCGDGVVLSTVHSAKGTEHDHVLLVGPWPMDRNRARQEEERRAFYVGMTRARKTLAVFDRLDVAPSLPGTLAEGPSLLRRWANQPPVNGPMEPLDYKVLGLGDIYLGYPGLFAATHPIHLALGALRPGDRLSLRRPKGTELEMCDQQGTCVARLSHGAAERWAPQVRTVLDVRVLAMVHRSAEQDTEPDRRDRYQISDWEVPIVELVATQRE
jgi:ATP-dependent DNA helicase RecQ